MKITFKNPEHEGVEASVTVPWLGALVFPIRTIKLVLVMRKVSRMHPERAEHVVHQVADAFEARGMKVERTTTKGGAL